MANETEPDYALLDRAGAAQVAFYPRRDHGPPPNGASDHLLTVAPGVKLGARLYAAKPALPTIVYFHGNGEVASDHDEIAPFYRQAGANLLVVEFRGYGTSDGQPTFATLVSDAREAAVQAHALLDERGFSGERFVMGRSMGAHSALEIAANAPHRFRGMILESGAGNLRRLAERFGISGDAADALLGAHEAKIRSIHMPALLIHGEVDELIPLMLAEEMQQMLDGTAAELLVIAGAGHNDIAWRGHREYFAAIGRFVEANSAASQG